MLEEVRITGLGVIDDALLELSPGFTALTGETGAGKTMVVTGLGLLFGGRADPARVRPGAQRASVEGRLRTDPRGKVAQQVEEAGGDVDEDGTLVLYPMAAANRRRERQPQQLTELARTEGWRIERTVDLSHFEQQGEYLEGTGSLVLDRTHRVAYATLSARTSATALNAFCRALDYRAISFRSRDRSGQPVYHTNVLMSVGPTLAILCSALFAKAADARAVSDQLQGDGKQLLDLSSEQIGELAGNVLFLDGGRAGPVVAVSTRAWQALSAAQRQLVELHARPALCSIDTIERCGGGGIRCMIAEIFLPRQGA